MGDLYRLDFASGKSYIGVTRRKATDRFMDHAHAAKQSAKGIVYHAWRKYGAPVLRVLATLENDDIYATERRAVTIFGTQHPLGYNMTPGGDIPPSLTPSVADKIRQKLIGRKLSLEQCERLRVLVTGRKHTAQAKLNMSVAQKGKLVSKVAREKMAAAKRGTSRTAEVRAKMSAAQRTRRSREGCTPQRWRFP